MHVRHFEFFSMLCTFEFETCYLPFYESIWYCPAGMKCCFKGILTRDGRTEPLNAQEQLPDQPYMAGIVLPPS